MFKKHIWKYVVVTILFVHLFGFCMDSWLIEKYNERFFFLDFIRNGLKLNYYKNLSYPAATQEVRFIVMITFAKSKSKYKW